VADEPIRSRNKVVAPSHLLVLDESLLDPPITAGLAPGGLLLINSPTRPEGLAARFPAWRVASVDAQEIARRHGIGTRALAIVSTTMVGAAARLLGLPIDVVTDTFRSLRLAGDAAAAVEAYGAVRECAPAARGAVDPRAREESAARGRVLDVTELRYGQPPPPTTGTWSLCLPLHEDLLAPCVAACPAGNDVVGFLHALAEGDVAGAAARLAETNPLPSVCGRVCPGFCMQQCSRRELDEAVDVRALERWATAWGRPQGPKRRVERGARPPATATRLAASAAIESPWSAPGRQVSPRAMPWRGTATR
jgi:hypothetical protein